MREEKDGTARVGPVWAVFSVLLLPALVFFLNRGKLGYPTAQWDGWVLDAAAAINAGTFALKPYLIHTPLYLYAVALSQKLGSNPLENARLFNYACWLLTGWLTYHIAKHFTPGRARAGAGLAAALLYYTSPLSVQGALLLDLGDTSLVPLAAAVYFCVLSCGAALPAGGMATAAAFALNLWVKMINPIFFAAAALLEAVLYPRDAAARRGLLRLLYGILIFSATWTLYAYAALLPQDRWLPIDYLFREMLYNFHRQDLSGPVSAVAIAKLNNFFRIPLWLWPPLALWAWRVFKRGFGAHPERFLNYFTLVFLFFAAVTKGTSNGFPKYHAVLLPLLCALGGSFAAEELAQGGWRVLLRLGVPAAVAVLLAVFYGGDPFYTFNYGFKLALIEGGGLAVPALLLALQLLVPAAAALALFFVFRRAGVKPAALAALLGAGLAWQAAIGLLQARGDYFTTYGYGTRGKAETVAYLASRAGSGAVLAPNEFEPELRVIGLPFIKTTDFCQADLACVLPIIKCPDTCFFVFGPASNTAGQVKAFLALTEKETGRAFTVRREGDFWIYGLGPVRRR